MAPSKEFDFSGTERFAVKRCIGNGAMGVVYEAWDKQQETRVALKTLRQTEASALYRFKREFRSLQDIQHPNLVRLGELVARDNQWFFTMEYVDGVDLLQYVRPAHGYPDPTAGRAAILTGEANAGLSAVPGYDESRLRDSLSQLARAICALHGAGKIHRDIKPSNVLVTTRGRAVLIDFGLIASTAPSDQSTGANIVGTASYMAPEQAWSERIGPEADWYSFGAVMYEAITGQKPHQGASTFEILTRKQQVDPLPPSKLAPAVANDLEKLCIGLLDREPANRPRPEQVISILTPEKPLAVRPDIPAATLPAQGKIPFIAREKELATLQKAFDESCSRKAVTVVVQGESGVGKTALVRHFTERLLAESQREVVVLTGRCYERESVPYKALDGVADSLSRYMVQLQEHDAAALLPFRASLLPQLFPVLLRVEVIARAPKEKVVALEPRERRKRMFNAFRELFRRLSQRHPVVLVIDDLQWADADSMALLEELMHPPEEPTLLLVVTQRPKSCEQDQTEPLSGDVRQVDLDVLTPENARELVALLSPRLVKEREQAVEAIARETRGHPLFIQELVLYLEHEETTVAPAQLDDALWSRVCRLPTTPRLLIEIVAVAGIPVSHETAANAAKITPADFETAASELLLARLARTRKVQDPHTIEPYHDRVREAILAHLDPKVRKHYHHRLAIALERGGAASSEPQVLVRHFEAAGESEHAAQHAEEAAHRAIRASAFDQAAELYRTCLRLGSYDSHQTRMLQMRLGQALVNSGRGPEAASVLLDATDGADPATRLECHRQAAEQLMISGQIERGLDAVEALLTEIGTRLPRTPFRALLSLLWYRLKLRLRGLNWTERHESQVTAEQLTRLDVYKSVSLGLAMVDNVRGADFNARYLLLALKTGEIVRVARALGTEAIFNGSQGGRGHQRGERLVAELALLTKRNSDPYIAYWAMIASGMLDYFRGYFRKAADTLAESEERYAERLTGATWEINNVRLFRVFCLRHLGAWQEASALHDSFLRDALRRGDRYMQTTLRRYCTFLFLGRDDIVSARQNLATATWIPPKGKFHLQHYFELEARTELALYQGQVKSASDVLRPLFDQLTNSLLTRIQIIEAIDLKLRGRVALALAHESGDAAQLKEVDRSASKLLKLQTAYGDLWAMLLRSGAAHVRGEKEQALHHLQDAMDFADKWGMRLDAAAARRRRGELLGGKAGERLIEQSTKEMQDDGIANPARLCNVFTPGFDTH